MRALILTARFPEYGYRGDQLRGRQLIEMLAPNHDLYVLTCGEPSHRDAIRELQALAGVSVIHAGSLARTLGALGSLACGRPGQVGWMAPRRFRRRAEDLAAGNDVVIVGTVRVSTGPLGAPVVLDHIDALSVSLRERARFERHPLTRLAARAEAVLLSFHERRAARWADAQIAVSVADAMALPRQPPPVVIPQAVFETIAIEELGSAGRDIDLILTGNMNYPPNRDAAQWLADEIAPAVRRSHPAARVMVAGRFADRLLLDGIEIASDVPDLSELLRRSRVAIAPIRGGTGVPNKLLEAAAAGAAIVTTPRAAASAGVAALTADGADELAAAVSQLLFDEQLRLSTSARALEDLASRARRGVARQLRDVLERVTGDTSGSAS